MRWISIKEVKPNMIIAKNIKIGKITLKENDLITTHQINAIKNNIGKSSLCWIPIKIKELNQNSKENYSLGNGMEVDLDTIDLLKCDVKIIEDIKNETENIINNLKTGNIVNHKEVANVASEFVDKIMKNDKILTYPLIMVKSYDAYTYAHLINVATLTAFTALNMGFERKTVLNAYIGGLYHDIGKISIPDEIIKKPSKLSKDEYEVIKTHPQKGVDILSRFENFSDHNNNIKNIILGHHEKINGQGYPKRLSENEIPILAKIAAVVDVYNALTTDRPYKKASSPYEAIRYIMQKAGIEFDIEIVKSFVKYVGIYPVGSKVKLNSGEIATVVAINKCCILRPIVKTKNSLVDLSTEKNLFVKYPYLES